MVDLRVRCEAAASAASSIKGDAVLTDLNALGVVKAEATAARLKKLRTFMVVVSWCDGCVVAPLLRKKVAARCVSFAIAFQSVSGSLSCLT